MENTLNREIITKSVYISVNNNTNKYTVNNTNFKNVRFFLSSLYWMNYAKKPTHATVPLMVLSMLANFQFGFSAISSRHQDINHLEDMPK
jgi:hypothetical protein